MTVRDLHVRRWRHRSILPCPSAATTAERARCQCDIFTCV